MSKLKAQVYHNGSYFQRDDRDYRINGDPVDFNLYDEIKANVDKFTTFHGESYFNDLIEDMVNLEHLHITVSSGFLPNLPPLLKNLEIQCINEDTFINHPNVSSLSFLTSTNGYMDKIPVLPNLKIIRFWRSKITSEVFLHFMKNVFLPNKKLYGIINFNIYENDHNYRMKIDDVIEKLKNPRSIIKVEFTKGGYCGVEGVDDIDDFLDLLKDNSLI